MNLRRGDPSRLQLSTALQRDTTQPMLLSPHPYAVVRCLFVGAAVVIVLHRSTVSASALTRQIAALAAKVVCGGMRYLDLLPHTAYQST
jgi:hypothetical protein